jgi:sarcosine oxidase subunit alpha
VLTNPDRPLTFRFNEESIPAVEGQSVAAALYAAGRRVFSRSFKYHRPRGLFCVSGDCPNCLMEVDGRPNVRTCIEPVREGQVVRHQNAWPSLDCDLLRVFDWLHRWLPVGFYYKRFHKPRWLWPVFEHIVRHIAGIGAIDVHALPKIEAEIEHLHAEVCVVGGGPAGMAAASTAAEAGADVLLLDRMPMLGGHLLYQGKRPRELSELLPAPSPGRLRTLTGTTVFGLYEGNLVGAFRGDRLLKIRARQIVVCTGSRQQPGLFANNDLPGILLADGVLRLAHLYGVRAGRRAVVLTDNDGGIPLAAQLEELGIELEAVLDLRPRPAHAPDVSGSVGLRQAIRQGRQFDVILQACGHNHLKAVRLARLTPNENVDWQSVTDLPCDLLCLALQRVPANELLLQGNMSYRHDGNGWVPAREVPGLLAAGGAAGTIDLEAQIAEGRRRGAAAAAALGYAGSAFSQLARSASAGRPALALRASEGKCFVCLCEDVTVKDIDQAVAEGFDHVETLKRYSTVNMGPCQGKMCGLTATALCARATGRELNTIGVTTSRPPVVPVELAVLAAGQRHHPVRRTPLHHWHQTAGARWMDAGQWKRPESYGDPVAEVRAVRTAVGLIDVSTLGKIELIGPDAAELLERIYLNRWADLKPGRVRYGAMCTEEGILFDDGIGARLAADRFYLTTTTGNAEAVFQWLQLWCDTWKLNVTVLNQTSALAAINLTGPRARDVLSQLTDLDVSPAAFPYMAMRAGTVAGVSCRLLRMGFVGELGYEIHCPAAHAWHLWESLGRAGSELGVKPFGVEAQRILRLEKGHIIIGQDTDALSNPLEAGLDWLVRFDKPAFHGREPLLRLKAMGPRSRLVGFHMLGSDCVPPEGSQVVEQGRPVGRVGSARFSPTLERTVGLAWIPAATALPGQQFLIRCQDVDQAARVVPLPFYDPEGKRLRA